MTDSTAAISVSGKLGKLSDDLVIGILYVHSSAVDSLRPTSSKCP